MGNMLLGVAEDGKDVAEDGKDVAEDGKDVGMPPGSNSQWNKHQAGLSTL